MSRQGPYVTVPTRSSNPPRTSSGGDADDTRPCAAADEPEPNRLRRFVWVSLAVFVVLAVLHTWPLALAPGTLSRNDNFDTVLHEWTLAWLAHQIVRDPLHLFDFHLDARHIYL